MNHLYQRLAQRVDQWRAAGYLVKPYPALAEILEWAREGETETLRCLRRPQLQALETYWYLRLVEGTPHIFDLYRGFFPKQSELLDALGLDNPRIKEFVLDEGID